MNCPSGWENGKVMELPGNRVDPLKMDRSCGLKPIRLPKGGNKNTPPFRWKCGKKVDEIIPGKIFM